MSKKNADREKEEEQDLDEDEDEDEDEEEEEEERPAAAKTAQRGRAHHAHDDHDDDEDEETSDEDDPYWWTPHAVMSVLVLFGVLGFFGVFNNAASKIPFLARSGGSTAEVKPEAKAEVKPMPPPTQREEFGAKHLLVQWKGSMRAAPSITRTEEEAKARATEALKKAKSGVKFEELVKEYSDEPNAGQRGGDLGKFRRGMMDPVFQAAVEKLKVGEVSGLVKTQFGYHIILRTM